MTIERNNNEIIIRLPGNIDTDGLQRLINFLKYREFTADSKAKQDQVNKLASDLNKNWWQENKDKFLKK